jgi:tetratricopeptide (TPR) repeat protein
MKYVSVTFVLFFLFPSILYSQTVLQLFQSGNDAFVKQQYSDALVKYERILDEGYVSAELYYNLGLSYFKLRDHAKARIFLERAHRLKPLDFNIRHGLEILREEIGDTYDFPRFPLLNVIPSLRHYIGQKGILYFAILGIWFLALILYFRNSLGHVQYYFIVGGALNFVIIVALALDLVLNSIESRYAIIDKPLITLFRYPDPNSELIEEIPEGTKIRIEEEYGAWTQVTLGNGSSGWVSIQPYSYLLVDNN